MSDRRARRRASGGVARSAPGRRSLPGWLPPVLVAAALLVGAVFVANALSTDAAATSYTCGTIRAVPGGSAPPGGFDTDDLGFDHVPVGQTIDYAECPPATGNHYSARGVGPLRPGFYGPDDRATPGGWLHNLEHGYAVVLYRGGENVPDDATLAQLEAFAANGPPTASAAACGYRSKLLVARFDDMPTPFAVLAWDRWLPMPEWDEATARAFAEQAIDVTAREPNAC